MDDSKLVDLRPDDSFADQLSSYGSRPSHDIPQSPAFDWRPYSIHLPYDLKVEHSDVLIMYDEVHSESASEMKDEINRMTISPHIKAKAVLFEEAALHATNHFTWLEEALKMHTEVFAIGTYNSTTDPILEYKMQASFLASIIGQFSRKECFTIILTSADQHQRLPLYLTTLKPICIYNQTWKHLVLKRLKCRINLRLARESEQSDLCRQYLEKHGHLTPSSASPTDSENSHSSSQGVSTCSRPGTFDVGARNEMTDSSIDGKNKEHASLTAHQTLRVQNTMEIEMPQHFDSFKWPMIAGSVVVGCVSLAVFLMRNK